MARRRRSNSKNFSRTARRVNPRNNMTPSRGGIRF